MLKAILKGFGVMAALIAVPLLLLIVGLLFSFVGPIAGILGLIFMPMIIAGIIIGYNEGKKK